MIVRYEVFDEDYIPDEILFRDSQMNRIAFCLKPAEHGSRPVNMLCLGPPATGKTTVMRYMVTHAMESLKGIYVNCQIHQTKQQIFFKIFENLYGYVPPPGISFQKLYSSILKKGVERGEILFVVLDDINLLPEKLMNEVIYLLLKGHEELMGFKVGISCISTDSKISAQFDSKIVSVFHPEEILFPVYDLEEMYEILKKRAETGIIGGKVAEDALYLIAEKSFEYLDLRFGINLLKTSVMAADRKGKDVVAVEDVEEVIEDSRSVFFRKMISALSGDEIDVLLHIYTSESRFTGDIYREMKTKMGYTKFFKILRKLEDLRLIDTAVRYEKGLRRYVVRKFKSDDVIRAVDEYAKRSL